ncbi:AlpA family phage regulatory protein [Hydrogenovibrio crunogenus]|jgi:Predicted transcriptional regulator|uniref:AlpA family phage regulatory protein n=2 Tax=Hydrogenovibrio crunogenus TaxID=39765 RepID=A0A4P7P0C2_9GAMM|nr:AlpA family phage regulatory protein [Hydrogenovibrio crunogenus]QBZ83458.1 AlpA family phage regulatory protein [Hydrogenovibrio crunogenus]
MIDKVPEQLLPLPKVEMMIGLKKSKIYALIKTGEFPKNRVIKGKALWLSSEIQNWISEQWQAAK